jgi:probable F420-dependent oxidoreductase
MTRYGLQIPWFGFGDAGAREGLGKIAFAAERAGFESLWLADHLWQSPVFGGPELDMLECYTTLGYLAATTERVRLGAMVSGVALRHPALLAKCVTTLDVLSGGRATLGLGVGWFKDEAEQQGFAFPPRATRLELLEETVAVVKQMWSVEDGPFEGKHLRFASTRCVPSPVQRPHPPILLGGASAAVILLAAREADAWNCHGAPPVVRVLVDALRRACEGLGRDPDEVERTWLDHPVPGRDLVAEGEALVAAGIQHVVYNIPPTDDLDQILEFVDHVGRDVIPAMTRQRA